MIYYRSQFWQVWFMSCFFFINPKAGINLEYDGRCLVVPRAKSLELSLFTTWIDSTFFVVGPWPELDDAVHVSGTRSRSQRVPNPKSRWRGRKIWIFGLDVLGIKAVALGILWQALASFLSSNPDIKVHHSWITVESQCICTTFQLVKEWEMALFAGFGYPGVQHQWQRCRIFCMVLVLNVTRSMYEICHRSADIDWCLDDFRKGLAQICLTLRQSNQLEVGNSGKI